jgi:predicted ATPase
LWQLGYTDQALQGNRAACDLAQALGHPFSLAYANAVSGWLHLDCRLGAEAEKAGDQAVRVATEQGFPFWHAWGTLLKAAGMFLQGRQEEALPPLRNSLDVFRAASADSLIFYLRIVGEAYTKAGRFEDARNSLKEGLAIVENDDERFLDAELHRLKGELHLAEADDQAAAECCFCTAIETARRQQSKARELRATMSLARLWQHQGRRDQARAALAAVYGTYTEGFTTPDLVDTAALLDSLA